MSSPSNHLLKIKNKNHIVIAFHIRFAKIRQQDILFAKWKAHRSKTKKNFAGSEPLPMAAGLDCLKINQ